MIQHLSDSAKHLEKKKKTLTNLQRYEEERKESTDCADYTDNFLKNSKRHKENLLSNFRMTYTR